MRALIGIDLDPATGLWDGLAGSVSKEIGGLAADPAVGDGSDELDTDESTGIIYGTNIVSGEILILDATASLLITAADILGSTGNLSLLAPGVDGIRADYEGHLILASMAGLLLSVDLAGIDFNGVDDSISTTPSKP